MPRLLIALIALVLLTLSAVRLGVEAQTGTPLQQGDPPVASLITISPPDDSGVVTISGAAGAVFPAAQVVVRNLYTGQTAYAQAGVTGTFSTTLYGPSNTPFWISPAANIPAAAKNQPGSLPGGPGTIVYGPFPETRTPTAAVTQLAIDGDVSDWQVYPQGTLATVSGETVYALRNEDSLYFGISGSNLPTGEQQLEINITFDGASYSLTLTPGSDQPAALKQTAPAARDRGTVPVAVAVGQGAIELRVSLLAIRNAPISVAGLNSVRLVDSGGSAHGAGGELAAFSVEKDIPPVNEQDGVFYLHSQLTQDFTRFSVSGVVANGAAGARIWTARGRVKSLALSAGDSLVMELDVTMDAPDVTPDVTNLRMIGQISLEPVMDGKGMQAAGGQEADNGWSHVLTPGGLPIDGLRSDFILGQTTAEAPQVIHSNGQLIFGLSFTLPIPQDFPAGIYVPVFHGWGQVGDGQPFRWEDNSLLGQGSSTAPPPLARLPLTLNITSPSVSSVTGGHLVWALFEDSPSDGSRGLLADEDRTLAGLSNRTRFNSPTYILPPFVDGADQPAAYPLEPYLLNQMPNAYNTVSAPLIPFLFPGGRLNVTVKRPDGTTDNLGSAPILQSALSTPELDERQRFGANSPVDVYRLTTLNPLFAEYHFDQYGQYQISLTGSLEDVWGNRYDGGGTYSLLVADLLDMTPGMLPGTPFEVGNWLNPGLTVAPAVPADVTITVHLYPLDGGDPAVKTIQGKADAHGYFHPAVSTAGVNMFQFTAPGEYVIDYEARYTDADGRLWAGSMRSAGVVGSPNSPLAAPPPLVAHGSRGLDGQSGDLRQAWFNLNQYATASGVSDSSAVVNYPYQSGDVAVIPDDANHGVNAVIRVQDTQHDYRDWMTAMLPNYLTPYGASINRAAIEGELPAGTYAVASQPYAPSLVGVDLNNAAYTYISAVRPGVTERQFVMGADDPNLATAWDPDDPDNSQLGAGVAGDRPGDYIFLFGGAVVRLAAAHVQDAAIYGALAVVLDPRNDALGTRVYPPFEGEAGGADGGPLLYVAGQPLEMFFHPTGVQPGQVLTVGDTLAIAGQVAPTVAANVSVIIITPSGNAHQFEGVANAIGYFYDPANDFAVDEAGIWTVRIGVSHSGWTSAGQVEAPPPSGGVIGAAQGTFQVYVLPANTMPMVSNLRKDFTFPAASPFNFSFDLPDGWTNVQVDYSLTMPGYILGRGQPHISGHSFSFQYNPTQISRDFPNYENEGRVNGPAVSDVLTLTFVITGTDAGGNSQITSRTFTIMHDRLISLE